MSDAERLNNSQEQDIEIQRSAAEQLEKLANNPESTVELSPRDIEAKAEKARAEALEKAVSSESNKDKKIEKQAATSRRGPISKKQLDKSFSQTMKQVQSELPTSSRIFSKVIHNKAVEKTSDFLGSTIARPNAMLAGAVMAFILTLGIYIMAKTIGYKLSGFETIAAFIVGWLLGIIYDYLHVLFTGKK